MVAEGKSVLTKARVVELLTFLAVILITPVSMIVAVPFGASPQGWVDSWDRYVFLLILLAIGLSVVGFGVSTDYRLRAEKLQKKSP